MGERCSGTNYLEKLVKENFKNIDLSFKYEHKHFTTDFNYDPTNTLVICIVRNPYDWLRSLYIQPHQLVDLWGLPFEIFIKKIAKSYLNFTVEYDPPSKRAIAKKKKLLAGSDNIIESYPNVLAMRKYKLQKYFTSPFPNVEIITYDNLVNNLEILSDIAKKYGITTKHPTINNIIKYKGLTNEKDYVPISYPPISLDVLEYINNELDWELENKLGFVKVDSMENSS